MPFSDQDEPGRSRRRRGRGRSQDDAGFDDFWGRESIGPPGRTRRRRSSDDAPTSPGDVGDLTGDVDARPPAARRPPVLPGAPVPAAAAASPTPHPPAPPPPRFRGPDRGAGTLGPPPRTTARAVHAHAAAAGTRTPRRPATRSARQAALERRRALEQGAVPGPVLPPAGYASTREPDPVEPVRRAWPRSEPRRWPGGDRYTNDHYGGDSYSDDTYGDDDYDDYDDAELDELPKRRGCRRALSVLAVLVVLAIVAGWFGWSWVQGKIDPAGPPGETVLVEIPEGTSTAGIGDVLAEAGVISDATVWDWYTKLRDVGTIKAGRYEMQLDSSFDEAIDALKEEPLPPEVERLVTVPPGLTQAQIATRLADPEDGAPGFTVEAVQAALADPVSRSIYLPADQASLEGTLYPETYAFEEGDTPTAFVQRMVQQFDQVATELDLNGRAAALGVTPYQALIVASMVEREAGTTADGPRVRVSSTTGGRPASRSASTPPAATRRTRSRASSRRPSSRTTRPTTRAPSPVCRPRRSPRPAARA